MIAVNLLDIFGKKKKKKQEQSVQSNKTQVSNNKVAPIAPVNSSNTTKKILGVQTQNSSIAPIAVDRQDILNKLKAQNEEKLKKQQEEQKIKELQSKVEEEKKKKGILTQEEINKKGKDNLLKNQFYTALDNKNKKTNAEEFNDLLKDNAKKQKEYIENSKEYKELSKLEASKTKASKENTKNGIRKLADNYLSFDPVYGEAYNVIKRINKKGKEGQKATPSDFILGGNALSATADSIRTSNEKALNSVEDNETTLLLKQEQERLRKELIANRKNSKKYTKILKDYNKISDALETEQASLLESKNGIGKIFDSFSSGFDSSVSGLDATVDKILGTKSEKRRGATQILSDKAMQETDSKIGKTALELTNSIGAMIPTMIAGLASGGAATAMSFGTYGGAAYNKAKQDGYTEEQATTYGIVNGTLEAALNKILPSFKIGGKNVYGKVATDKLTSKIMAKTIGNEALKRLITDAGGEFTEEYLQEFLDPIVREAILEENNGVGIIKGKNVTDIASNIAKYTAKNFFSKENLHAGLLGALSSGLMGAPSAVRSNAYTKATGRSAETGLTQNEQKVVDSIVENRKAELKEKNGKVTKKDISKIEQEVRQDLERGYIETNDIERALSNEEWTKHDNAVKQKESLQKELDELNSRTMDKITPPEYKRISELEEQIKNIDTDTTRNELNSAMNGKVTDNDTLLQRTYGEEIEKKNAYQFDKNEKLTEQTKKINEDIKKLGLNNNIKTRDAIDILKKVSNETGRQYRLVNNNSTEVQTEYKKIAEKIAKMDNISMEEALKQTENLLIDGFVSDGQVFINVESNNLMRAITGHETTHLFEGTEDYKKLQKIAFKYAETKGEYNSRRKSLEKRYRGIENAKIDNELTSDLVGDYLFSDIEFVRNLSTEQPNIFNKMYNYVKHLYNMATAGSKEARQLEQLKYNFEKVYKENNQSKASNDTKLMASNIEKTTKTKYNSISEAIDNDMRKRKFLNHSNSVEYFNLDYEVMDEINAVVSTKAHKSVNGDTLNFTQFIEEDKKTYTIYADIMEDDGYYINNAEEIRTIVEEVADETRINQDSQYSLEEPTNEQGKSDFDTESIDNQRTSTTVFKVSEEQERRVNNKSINKEVVGDSKENIKGLNSSSFSLDKNNNINKLTDNGITMTYVRNPDAKTQNYGETYGQNLEPAGQYMNMDTMQGKNKIAGLEYGEITFEKPLVIDNTDTTAKGWKKILSDKYDGLTGKKLSQAIVKDGYDAVMTRDSDGNIWEVVNLKDIKNKQSKYSISNKDSNDIRFSLSSSLQDNNINITTDINNDFFKEHETDFDKNNGKNHILYDNYGNKIEQTTNVYKLEKGNNLAKLSATLEQNVDDNYGKLYIEELYVKNKGEGLGTEIINSLKQYAKENNLDLYTMKELGNPKTQKFWNSVTEQDFGLDKTSRQLYSYYQPGYNISKTDSTGKKLSYEQRQYFKDSKVVDENRNLIPVYHGSPKDFTIFDLNKIGTATDSGEFGRGFYFTDNQDYAKEYATGDNKNIKSVYLNIKNPYIIDSMETLNEFNKMYLKDSNEQIKYMKEYEENYLNKLLDDSTKEIKEMGYDGVIFKAFGNFKNNQYVAFEPNQIKNVDNTNPTSNPDIRYAISDKGELQDNKGNSVKIEASDVGNTGTLMAIHNLGENKFNGILDLDGIPVPSIAITNPEIVNHKQFGDGTLIFNKSTIDPAVKANEVYDRDVWSPTFPTIEYDVNVKDLNKVRNIVGGYGNEYLSGANSKLNNIEEIINRNGYDGLKEDLKDNKDFKYVYYKTLNPDFKIFTKTDASDVSTRYSNEFLQEFINEYGKEIPNWGSIEENQRKEIVEKFKEKWIPVLEQKRDSIIKEENKKENPRMFIIGMANSTVESNLEWLNSLGGQDKLIENLNEIQRTGGTKEVNDYQKTNDYINDNINQEDYEKWIDDNFKSIVGKKGIYNGKEYLTPQGNRRTFNQLHEDYNLKNLVKELTKQSTVAGESGFGAGQNFGTLQAKMSNKFNSIEDIKNAENRIQYDENSKELIDSYSNEIYEYMNQLREYSYYKDNNYFYGDNAGYALNDFADYKTQNIDNLKKALEKNGINSKEVPTELLNNIVNSINELKNIPTDYFEAKPQRAVGLDEIEMAVIPNNWSAETKQRLTDRGIKYTEYDPSIEGDRQRVINQYDNLKFMLSNRNDIAPISNNDIRARDMLLPRQQETQQEVEKIVAPIKEENKVLKQEVKALQKEVRDIQENNAVTLEEYEEYRKRIAPLLEEQEAPPEVEQVYDNLKDTTRMPKKELKMLSKNIKDTLGLTNRQKLDLEEIIQDYSTSETATREDLYNDIKKRYGKQAIITEYEDIRNVQRKIKSMKLDVSDNIRHDIADYNMLRQKNFGKLSFSRNGQPVDSVYQELSSEYPNYFPSSIYNETDQFLRMVEVANLENKSIEEYNIDDNYVRETSDYIYDSIMDSKQDALQKAIEKTTKESLQGDLKAPLPTVFDTSSIEADNAYDEVRLMEHKARKKQKVNKTSNVSRDSGLAPYIEFAREHNLTGNDEVIETLNEADAAEENKRIEAQKKIKPQSENSIRKALTYGQYLFTNRNVEIDNYAEETGNHNIKVLADHINNIQGEISTNINDAQTDNFGKTIGKSITQIFSQADKAGLSEPFNDYLFHLSNIERHKWGKGSQVPMVDSLVLTEKYEKAYPEMKSWAKEVNKYNKNLLYKQADAGLITKELADNLSDRYEFYVPFMENLEGEYTPDSSNTIKTRSTVKRAKGGADRNLLGFEEAMINQTSSAISQIRKNQLYQEIAKTVDNATIDFDTNTNPDINNSGLMSDGKKYYLTAYVDGKATQVEIDKSLYHGLAQEGNRRIRNAEQKLAPLTNPLQKASNIRRNILTTWSPSFLATNMLKDIQDAPLNSKYASDMIKNYPKALKEIATGKGEHVEAFLNMYGQGNLRGDYNLDSGLADATELVKSSSKNKGIEISKSVLKKIPQMNEVIELAPRYAEYLASLENGCSQMEALYNAREVTTNFGRGGIITKALNRNGFTFLNANVQGMSRLVRNFSGANGARGVVNSLTKVAALGIAPALFNALMYGSGDDEDKDYKALPDYIKDNYYLIKTSNNNFIRIPKGRMLSIFGSAARRTLELSQGEKDAFNGYISNAYNQVGVQNPIESNIFAPLIQAKNNKTWYGSDLVPSRLQDKPKDEQYDSSTDKFSIWLGQKTKISPYKINYVIDQYSGGIGDMILPTITEEAQSDTNSTLGTMIAPLKDKFTADSTTDNKYVSDFYTKNDELKVKANSSKATDKDKLTNQYMKTISFEMGQLYGEMRKVQEDKKLSKSEKYRKAQNIKKEINKLAEEGLNGYNKVSKVGDYAEVGEREFYKWTNDEGETVWSKPKDEDLDKLNSLGLTIGEKSEYYKTRSKLFDVWDKYKDNYDKSKSEAIKAIRKSNMSDDAKYALYNASYNKDEEMNIAQEVGIEADAFLDYMAQTFKADKNRYGKSISGSKKAKILNYINSMNIEPEQRMILYKMQYKTNNYYNNAIVNYLNNSSLTYEEEEYILKKLGFKVSKNGNISW